METAIVAPVFFAMILGLIETGWMMTKVAMVESAVTEAARLIYTGQAPDKSSIEQQICDRAVLVSDCASNINIEILPVADFASRPTDGAECRDSGDVDFEPSVSYQTGGGGEIVFLRVCVTTDILVPGLGLGLALPKNNRGRFEIVSTTAFMNEPF
ncbi:MAG: TadE/TadG family type IV pilus assembly protein [Pseudomonadota bacterium]